MSELLTVLRYRVSRLLQKWANHSRDSFSTVQVETLTACNRRCAYCPNSQFDRGLPRNSRKMETALFHRLIGQLAHIEFRGRLHPHFYNEPLMDDRLAEWVRYAKGKLHPQAEIEILTNGDLLTVELYEKLVQAGVDSFLITRHPPCDNKAIEKVMAYRHEIKDRRAGIRFKKLTWYFNRGGLVGLTKSIHSKNCLWATEIVTVDHRGNVLLCCNDYFSTVRLGNIQSEKLIDIWETPRFRKIRKDLRHGNFGLDLCKHCRAGLRAE